MQETIENELEMINKLILKALEAGEDLSILLDQKYELLNEKYRSFK
jgi:hypothetical protein